MCVCARRGSTGRSRDAARSSSGRRRSGRAGCSRGCTPPSRARASSRSPGSGQHCLSLLALRAIEGSAVAGPVATTQERRESQRAPQGGEGPVASRGTSRAVPSARRQARRWWGHRPQVGEPSSATRRLHDQLSRKYLQTAQIRVVRSPALCGGVRDTSCRAQRSFFSAAPRRRRSRPPAPPTGWHPSSARSALPSRALRRRVGRRASAVHGGTARTTPAGARGEPRPYPTPRRGRPQLARGDQRKGRDTAAPALRRRRPRPDRRPARRPVAAGDARRRAGSRWASA